MTAWTPELVADLSARWNRGESVDNIAHDLNLARNQVTGKVSRLRDVGHKIEARGAPAALAAANRPRKTRNTEIEIAAETSSATRAPVSVQTHGAAGKIMSFDARLVGDGCLYIEGDPAIELQAGRDPHCGQPRAAGSVYCAEHHAMTKYSVLS